VVFGQPEVLMSKAIMNPVISGQGSDGDSLDVAAHSSSVVSVTFHCFKPGAAQMTLILPIAANPLVGRSQPVKINFIKECGDTQKAVPKGLGGVGVTGFNIGLSKDSHEVPAPGASSHTHAPAAVASTPTNHLPVPLGLLCAGVAPVAYSHVCMCVRVWCVCVCLCACVCVCVCAFSCVCGESRLSRTASPASITSVSVCDLTPAGRTRLYPRAKLSSLCICTTAVWRV